MGATPDGGTSTGGGSELDVCRLVSAADVEAVLGEAALSGRDYVSPDDIATLRFAGGACLLVARLELPSLGVCL